MVTSTVLMIGIVVYRPAFDSIWPETLDGLVEGCQQDRDHEASEYQKHSAVGGRGDRGGYQETLFTTVQSRSAARVYLSRRSLAVSRGNFSIATRLAAKQTLSKSCAASWRSPAV